MQLNKFTEQEFRDWVFSKEDEQFIGISSSPTHCPLARYLKYLGYKDVLVAPVKNLPTWAKEIANYVDGLGDTEIIAGQLKEYYAQNS